MTLDIKQWLRANLTKKIRFGRDSREWDLIFDATCWFLWLYRNRLVYETDGVESWSVLAKVRHWFEYTDVGIQSLDGSNPVATTLVSAGQNRQWVVQLQHVLRDGNKVVDALARMITMNSLDIVYWEEPPLLVANLLYADLCNS
ncbi:hypothetical protein V6N13_006269 [Hibiscus sabdariffa]